MAGALFLFAQTNKKATIGAILFFWRFRDEGNLFQGESEMLPRSLGRGRGFSLLELVFGLFLLCILAGLAFPMVQVWNRETELRWGARCVANIFRDARSRAITHNREHWVEVDLTSQRVRTTMGDRAYRSSPPGITVVDWAPLPASVILHGNADCSLKEGKKVMQFNPDGSGNTGYVCIMAAGSPPQRRFRVGIPFAANGRIVIGR